MNDAWFAQLLERSQFLRRYPAYAGLLATCVPVATDRVPLMAIGRHWRTDGTSELRLFVNRAAIEANPEHFAGVLQHELHHALYGHLDRADLHRVGSADVMELAMETTANEHIAEPAPPGFEWQDFAHLGLRAGQSTLERYRLLERAQRAGRLQIVRADAVPRGVRLPNGFRPDPSQPVVVTLPDRSRFPLLRPRPTAIGKPWNPNHRPGDLRTGARGVGDALDRVNDRARRDTWRGNRWLLGGRTPPAQIERWQLTIKAFLGGERGGSAHATGRLAGTREMAREVRTLDRDGQLAWPRILQQLLASLRAARPVYNRPNRRFPERVGELPGRVRRPPRPRLLVGIDTSASVDEPQLARIAAELRRLARHADCTIAECDSCVHRVHRDLRLTTVTGGGDTDLSSLFALLDTHAAFDAVVYFTDGIGRAPATAPRQPVLWVLPAGRALDCPWGRVVRLG